MIFFYAKKIYKWIPVEYDFSYIFTMITKKKHVLHPPQCKHMSKYISPVKSNTKPAECEQHRLLNFNRKAMRPWQEDDMPNIPLTT